MDGQKIKAEDEKEREDLTEDELIDYITSALDIGLKTKEISEIVCLMSSLSARDAYKLVIKTKREKEK